MLTVPVPTVMGPGRLPAETAWVLLPDGYQVPLAAVSLLFALERRGVRLVHWGPVLTCRSGALSAQESIALAAHSWPLRRLVSWFASVSVQ